MKKIHGLFVVLLILSQALIPFSGKHLTVAAQTQTQTEAKYAEKIKKIEAFVKTHMKSEGAVGLTIGFIKDDFRWVKGFGYADLENKLPAQSESSYRMASVTKPMTAIGILTLVEQGKIDLDDEVQKYVPYFPKKKYPITIRQLLGHLGGISHYQNYDLEGHFKDHKTTREAIAVFENFDLVAEPGTRYNYTSYGFNLLGAVIEGASGQSYGEYMTKNVWQPLEMKDTLMDDPLKIIPNRVKGYQLINGEIRNSEFIDISSRFAGGGTRSTVPDLLNFAENLYRGKILKAETRSAMWTAQATREGRNIGYGFGWGTNTANGRFVVGHGGAQQETKTYLLIAPKMNFAAAVGINFEESDAASYVTKIFEIIMDEPWSIKYYTADQRDELLLRGLDTAFDFGMRHYDQFGTPLAKNETELAEAFKYFSDALKTKEPVEFNNKLALGAHPASKEAFVKMVSYIADKLNQNGKNLDPYYKRGVLLLFDDYIKWYQTQPDYQATLKFDKSFEQKIAKFSADWAKTWTDEMRQLDIDATQDLTALGANLSKKFAGASVYPNFINEIDDLVVSLATQGKFEEAFAAGQLNHLLYPASDQTNATLGTLLVVAGQKDQALPLLKRSLELNPRGAASAGSLNGTAYNLLNIGQTEAGLQLLLVAAELHPTEANLYDSIGDFYLRLKNNEKAIEFYQKAITTDPNYPNAKVAQGILDKLKK